MNGNHSDEWVVSNLNSGLTRRRAIGVVATVVGGGTGLAYAGSERGRAEVSVEEVDVSDATFEAPSVEPVVNATIAYAYRHDSPTELVFELLVDDSVVAGESLRTNSVELENDTDLSGRVVDSAAWDASDFAVENGERIEREVTVGVRFAVVENSEVMAEDTATDTATVVVEHPNDSTATVGLSASITDGS